MSQAELVDLPEEDEEKPKVRILTPKIVILGLLICYFASQNIYHYLTQPAPSPSEVTPPSPSNKDDEFWELFTRFQNYIIVSVVGFVIFYYLRRANEDHEEAALERTMAKEAAIEEEAGRKQREREASIIRKLEEEERQVDERQMRMAASNNRPGDSQPSRDRAKENYASKQKAE